MKHLRSLLILFLLTALAFPYVSIADAQERKMQHCVVELAPVQINENGVPAGFSEVISENCFANPAAAMAFITDGVISLDAQATQAEVDAEYQRYLASSQFASFIVAQLYESTNYNNLFYQYVASQPCSGGLGYSAALSGSNNDRADSGSAFAGCNTLVVTEHSNWGGAALWCLPGCTNFGVLNNEVSAWYVHA